MARHNTPRADAAKHSRYWLAAITALLIAALSLTRPSHLPSHQVHYNSLYPASEPPPPSPPPRDASSSPTPGSKPRKVLGSRTLGKVVTRVAHGAKSAGHSVAATVSGSPSKR